MWRAAVAPRLLASSCRVRDSDRVRVVASTQIPSSSLSFSTASSLPLLPPSSPIGSRRRYSHHAPAALLVMATMAASVRPAVATTMEQQQQQRDSSTHAQTEVEADVLVEDPKLDIDDVSPVYGCLFRPRDIFYDEATKQALGMIRSMERDEVIRIMASSDDAGADAATREKLMVLSSLGSPDAGTLTLIGYKGGPMESQINQDRAFCVDNYRFASMPTKENRLLGVFDGHAKLGELVSEYSSTTLPGMLAEKLERIYGGEDDGTSSTASTTITNSEVSEKNGGPSGNVEAAVKQALIDSFLELDQQAPAEKSGGCTASVVLQLGSKVYIANAGDSQSFIVTYRPSTKTTTIAHISREDKPDLPDERARVEAAGGSVYAPVRGTSRVLYVDPQTKMQSGLAMSRSIGDWEAGKVGVIPNPLVDVVDIDMLVKKKKKTPAQCEVMDSEGNMVESCWDPPSDESDVGEDDPDIFVFAISATDGLLDFSTPNIIAETIASSLCEKDGPHLLTACEQLLYMAAQGWERARQGRYRDDIAISVAMIRRPPPSLKQ